jgi:hypothetical protein
LCYAAADNAAAGDSRLTNARNPEQFAQECAKYVTAAVKFRVLEAAN